MNDDLIGLGNALEAAIDREITAHRHTTAAPGHGPGDHIPNTSETTMHLIDDHDGTSHDDHDHEPVGVPTTGWLKRRSRRVALIGTVAVLGIGGAAAATAVRLSSDDVSHGLPGGSVLFTGTDPSCTTTDDVVFHCTLASAPTQDVMPDYTGAAEIFVDTNSDVAGGCRGQSADGLQWICYVGQRAVDEQIISAGFLGEHVLGPGRG